MRDPLYSLALFGIRLFAMLTIPGLPDGWWTGEELLIQSDLVDDPSPEALVFTYFQPDDVGRALAVMDCESGGNPDAKNPYSTASGLFQHLASMWPERSEAAGWDGYSVFDPEANVAVAAWLVYEGGGWSHWNASKHCWSGNEVPTGHTDLVSGGRPSR